MSGWDMRSPAFPGFTEPDPSYHGLSFWPALGAGSYIIKARVQLLRDLGPAISPFNAFLTLQGVETLSLRMERHWQNADKVARFLDAHPQVSSVSYAGLESSPWHERAKKYFEGRGFGSVLAFEIAARAAFREGMPKCGPVLLEPIMKVEVVTPEEYMGDVIGDLSSRRGQVTGMDSRGNARVVDAMVPLASMFGYVNTLRSMSAGFRAREPFCPAFQSASRTICRAKRGVAASQ